MTDADFITYVVKSPRVWDNMAEDGLTPDMFHFDASAEYFILPDRGFMAFRRVTRRMWDSHIAMLRGGKDVPEFGLDCLDQMRKKHGATKFVAPIGSWNKAALRLVKFCGFVEEGRLTAAYYRNGKPFDMIFMGKNYGSVIGCIG